MRCTSRAANSLEISVSRLFFLAGGLLGDFSIPSESSRPFRARLAASSCSRGSIARLLFQRPLSCLLFSTAACSSTTCATLQWRVIVDLEERRLIAARLKAVDENLFALQRRLSKLRAQKLGLMQDLLTGKVRVPLPEPEVTA